MPKSNRVNAQKGDLSIQAEQHQYDAPIISVSVVEALSKRNSLAWYKNEISAETDNRRKEDRKERKRRFVLMILLIIFPFLFLSFVAYFISVFTIFSDIPFYYFMGGFAGIILAIGFLVKCIKN